MTTTHTTAQELAKSFVFGYNLKSSSEFLNQIEHNNDSFLFAFAEKLSSYAMAKMLIDANLQKNEEKNLKNCVQQLIIPFKLSPMHIKDYIIDHFQKTLIKKYSQFTDENQILKESIKEIIIQSFLDNPGLSHDDKQIIVQSFTKQDTNRQNNSKIKF
jgi:HD superfamily phosphodiesterase